MHWQLLALLSLFCQMLLLTLAVRKRRESWRQDCRSCVLCSRENGCLRCSERLFLFLRRDGILHHGSCLHSCPAGHFGLRGKELNRCMKCKAPECERCFNKDFCTKCKIGFLLFKGKCFKSCPEGTFAQSTDCVEGCVFSVFGFWSEWSSCQHNGLSCGVTWGLQSRTRELSRNTPEEKETLCPPQTESRKCQMKRRCRKDKRKNEKRQERRNAQKKLKLYGNRTITNPPQGNLNFRSFVPQ
ncbi:R-spondin-4 precursor [Danio rerio]|uniref:R-spondin 4 n=1 Tax=Danio rerio TaxID=7955 RepID=M5AN99_DANRE|nr:R-spondin-4 precursor [Danio rerio]BAN10334.1 r-spondin 4 [Danio rerio]|eukprot:NP_001274481.1 R-spondin-4 precursor [Danio rerio]